MTNAVRHLPLAVLATTLAASSASAQNFPLLPTLFQSSEQQTPAYAPCGPKARV